MIVKKTALPADREGGIVTGDCSVGPSGNYFDENAHVYSLTGIVGSGRAIGERLARRSPFAADEDRTVGPSRQVGTGLSLQSDIAGVGRPGEGHRLIGFRRVRANDEGTQARDGQGTAVVVGGMGAERVFQQIADTVVVG